MTKRSIKFTAMVLCAALMFAGCVPTGNVANDKTKNAPVENTQGVGENAAVENAAVENAAGKDIDTGGSSKDENVIIVGTTGVPYEEILNMAAKSLAEQKITLVVKSFDDPAKINEALAAKQIDAAFFQNAQSLEKYVLYSNAPLMPVGRVIVRPMGIYSSKIKNIDELEDGATIVIPNTEDERAKALYALSEAGVIRLSANGAETVESIAGNPKNLKFIEESEGHIPTIMSEVDAVVSDVSVMRDALNSNRINIDPSKDALYIEDWESIYAYVLAVHYDNFENPKIASLYEVCTNENARAYINENFEYDVIPAF